MKKLLKGEIKKDKKERSGRISVSNIEEGNRHEEFYLRSSTNSVLNLGRTSKYSTQNLESKDQSFH